MGRQLIWEELIIHQGKDNETGPEHDREQEEVPREHFILGPGGKLRYAHLSSSFEPMAFTFVPDHPHVEVGIEGHGDEDDDEWKQDP